MFCLHIDLHTCLIFFLAIFSLHVLPYSSPCFFFFFPLLLPLTFFLLLFPPHSVILLPFWIIKTTSFNVCYALQRTKGSSYIISLILVGTFQVKYYYKPYWKDEKTKTHRKKIYHYKVVKSRFWTWHFQIPDPKATQSLVIANSLRADVTQAPLASKPD